MRKKLAAWVIAGSLLLGMVPAFAEWDGYTGEDAVITKIPEGVAAVFNYNNNIYLNGKVKAFDEKNIKAQTMILGGVPMVPIIFFEHMDAAVTKNDGGYKIVKSGKTIALRPDEAEYKLNGSVYGFGAAPRLVDGLIFVPAAECAEALGYSAKTFGDLTVIGTNGDILVFEKNNALLTDLTNKICLSYVDPSSITKADFTELKKRWREYYVGNENNDLSDEAVMQKINAIDASGKKSWDGMNLEGDITILFGQNFPVASSGLTEQYSNLNNMAMMYGTYGSEFYGDAKLKSDILFGLEWLYNNLYGQAEIENRGWRDTTLHNWWDWFHGTPLQLMPILLVLGPEMNQADINKYMSPTLHFWANRFTTDSATDVEERLASGCIIGAVITEDVQLLFNLLKDVEYSQRKTDGVDGTKVDYMYIWHGLPYTGTYGISQLFGAQFNVSRIHAGTKLAPQTPYGYEYMRYIENTFAPVIYNGKMMSMVQGRAIIRGNTEISYGTNSFVGALVRMIGVYGPDEDIYLKTLLKHTMKGKELKDVTGNIPLVYINTLKDVLDDESIPEYDPKICRVYHTGDRVVQQREGYAIGISMSSPRIGRYEDYGENTQGWYTGDGMLYLYNDSEADANPFGSSYWSNVDWHRMPGTTEDTQRRQNSQADPPSTKDFVGGAELENEFAAVAMFAQSSYRTLHAQKAWFLFDDEVVALGAGINSATGVPINTYVENRRLGQSEVSDGRFDIIKVTASGDDGNVPENMLDDDPGTRWSMEGTENVWVIFELEESDEIGKIVLSWYGTTNGSKAIFDIEVSEDGENWTTLYAGESESNTDLQVLDMDGARAKYIRYNGYGRTNSLWNSISRFRVYPKGHDDVGEAAYIDYGITTGTELFKPAKKGDGFEKTFINLPWVHLPGVAGYYFPNGGEVTLRTTTNSVRFFEMWFGHGKKPSNETYSYVLLPGKTAQETSLYAAKPDISIISNTEKKQIVRENNLGITGMVFWESGEHDEISVSKPLILMIRESGGEYVLSLSDPTQKLDEVVIEIDRELALIGHDKGLTIEDGGSATFIKADLSGSNGKTFTAKFTIN